MKARVMVSSYCGVPTPSFAEVYHLVVPEAGNLCITFENERSATVARGCPDDWKHLTDVEVPDDLVRDAEAFLTAHVALERRREAVTKLLAPLPPPRYEF